jgi:hypothetical protein
MIQRSRTRVSNSTNMIYISFHARVIVSASVTIARNLIATPNNDIVGICGPSHTVEQSTVVPSQGLHVFMLGPHNNAPPSCTSSRCWGCTFIGRLAMMKEQKHMLLCDNNMDLGCLPFWQMFALLDNQCHAWQQVFISTAAKDPWTWYGLVHC